MANISFLNTVGATVIINGEERESITVQSGTNVVWSVSKTGYVTQSGSQVVYEDTVLDVVLVRDSFTLTISPTPSNATVKINGTERMSATFRYGSSVNWEVSCDGYYTQSGTWIAEKDETLKIELEAVPAKQYSLTINVNPSRASINFTADGTTYEGTGSFSKLFDEGTKVTWSVIDPELDIANFAGCYGQTGSWTAEEDTVLDIELERVRVSFTVNAVPSSSYIKLSSVYNGLGLGTESDPEEGNGSLTISNRGNSTFYWTVSCEGYATEEGDMTVNDDTEITVTLAVDKNSYTFSIEPSLED